jgi:NADH dehydrogenase
VLSDGKTIPTHTVVWAGGLKASSLSEKVGVPTGRGGRFNVEPDLTITGHPKVYALGDFANHTSKGQELPQLASVAEQAGKWCARNILADIEGKQRQPFNYFDKGIMAMIGRSAAVAEIGPKRYEMEGVMAFTAWLGVHAALLSTMRARIEAFVEWAWDYFSDVKGDQVLDRFSEADIDWGEQETVPKAASDS